MICKICEQESFKVFQAKLLNKNESDAGYVSRNISLTRKNYILF